MSRFIQHDRNQHYLLPPSADEWLPESHLARFVVEVTDQLDLSKLTRRYSGRGSAAYHPAMLLALLVYGYATGVFSSRKIGRATYGSVASRFIAANHHPDHDTLAHFRKTFLMELEDLFVQVLALAQTMKLAKLGQISLDGAKIKANASKHKALSYGHIEKLAAQRREEVQALLKKAADIDQEALADGIDLPAEVARREDRLKALAEAKAKIAERVKERDDQARKDYEDKLAGREALRAAGKKPRGKGPKVPEVGPQPKDQINLTDEESRTMPSADGFVQGYNAQTAVDAGTMLVIAATLTQHTNDKQQIEPMLSGLQALQNPPGKPDTLLADNGHFSEDNVQACVAQKISPLIALGREARHLPLEQRLAPDVPEPESTDALAKMAWKLKTQQGRALYGKRKSTVGPVFGIIKQALGFRQFPLRGLDAVAGGWKLVTMAFNLKRMQVLAAGQQGKHPEIRLGQAEPR